MKFDEDKFNQEYEAEPKGVVVFSQAHTLKEIRASKSIGDELPVSRSIAKRLVKDGVAVNKVAKKQAAQKEAKNKEPK